MTTPVPLQYRVESIIDCLTRELVDRAGVNVTVVEFDALSQKLSERVGDLVQELVWDAAPSSVGPIGDGAGWAGDGREITTSSCRSTDPDPERPS